MSPSSNQPPPQLIFQVTPLSGRQWGVVLQISLPVILLDEALKYLSRHHVDGEWSPAPSLPSSAIRLQRAVPASASVAVGDVRGSDGRGPRCLQGEGPWEPAGGLLRATLPRSPSCRQPCPAGLAGPSLARTLTSLDMASLSKDSLPGLCGQLPTHQTPPRTGLASRVPPCGRAEGGSLFLNLQL